MCTHCTDAVILDETDLLGQASSGPIHLARLACTGTEDYLTDCSVSTDVSGCTHSQDAALRCQRKYLHLFLWPLHRHGKDFNTLFLQRVPMERSAWLKGAVLPMEEWSSVSTSNGARFVTMAGMWTTAESSADS